MWSAFVGRIPDNEDNVGGEDVEALAAAGVDATAVVALLNDALTADIVCPEAELILGLDNTDPTIGGP